MAYVDKSKLFEQLPAFNKNRSIYEAAMDTSISDAQAVVDGYLSAKFAVPFPAFDASPAPVTPALVTTITSLFARAFFLSGAYLADASNAEPRMAKLLYDRAEHLIEEILEGNLFVVGAGGAAILGLNLGIYSNTRGKKPTLKNFDLESEIIPSLHTQMRGNDWLPNAELRALGYGSP